MSNGPNYEYFATLRTDQLLASLLRIEQNFEKLSQSGDKHFQQIGKSAELSGVQIGVIGGLVAGLTTKFIELGQAAFKTLADIAKSSTAAAGELQTAGKVFEGVFQGNEEAGTAALERLREVSRKLGLDLVETGKAFVPEVGSLAELERVAKLAAGLAASQPEQGSGGARIALQEALTGNLISLQKRFEISDYGIENIRQLQKELGNVPGLLQGLEIELQRVGKDIDNLTNTYTAAAGRVEQQGKRFQEAMGLPIVEELQSQFDDLGAVLEERGVDFEEIAGRVGELVASVADFVGTNLADFLTNLDTEQTIQIVDNLQGAADSAYDLVDALALLEWPDSFLSGLEKTTQQLDEALGTAVKLSGLAKAEIAAQAAEKAETEKLTRRTIFHQSFEAGVGPLAAATGIPGAKQALEFVTGFGEVQGAKLFMTDEQKAQVAAAGEKARQDALLETVKILEQTGKAEEDREAKRAARAARAKGDEAAADAFLAEQQAAREAAAALAEYNAAKEKVDQAREKAETDHQRRLDKITLDAERDRLKQEQDFADQRLDLAKKNLEKIEDIERGQQQGQADAAKDLTRDEQDIARKQSRARVELEKETAKSLVKVEENYRDRLAEIRRQFEGDIEEAERNQDAIAFIGAIRRRDKAVEEAKLERTQSVDEAKQQGEERRQELTTRNQEELEDAQIKNRRKLEDLQTSLAREFEEQQIAYERDLQAQATAEQRKTEAFQTALQQRRADQQTAYQQAIADLEQKLSAELEIIRNYEQQKTEVTRQEVERRANLARRTLDRAQQSRTDELVRQGRTVLAGRQHGGPVSAATPYLVGEAGPELFVPQSSGLITPGQAYYSPRFASAGQVSNTVNSGNRNVIMNVDPGVLSDAQMMQVKHIVNRALYEFENAS